MRSATRWTASFTIAISASVAGCKVGNPMDRTVKVTQEPTLDPLDTPSPRTRLAAGSLDRTYASTGSRQTTDTAAKDTVYANELGVQTAVSRKTPAFEGSASSKSTPAPNGSMIQRASAETPVESPAKKLPREYAELLEAFRDSPQEVQQQALRQLLAVSGQGAVKSQSPESIADAIRSSMAQLPELPDDLPETTTLPHRLASGDASESRVKEVTNALLEVSDQSSQGQIHLSTGSLDLPAGKREIRPLNEVPDEAIELSLLDDTATENAVLLASEQELYEELSRRLSQTVAGESDADRYRRQIISRHLSLFSGDPDAAVAQFEGMTAGEQEFLRHYLLGLWTMVDKSGHPVATRRWSAALPDMRLATQKLSGAAESLDIPTLAFCREIQSFGQVTKFESPRFTAGQKVILYCEIDNFLAVSTPAGFETHLQGSYEVFDAKGQKVAGQVLPADKQLCANHLRDYFIAYQMNLPSGLEPGEYRLELTMECLKGQKYGQSSIGLDIVKSPVN